MTLPDQRPTQDRASVLAAVLSFLSRPKPYAFGPVVGGFTLYTTHELTIALLACVLAPAAVAGGLVLARWIELLEPPSRFRRPRRRGS
jgi:hypothetical protein